MKIRKLLAAAIVLIMVFAAIPVLSLAEGARTVATEAIRMSKLDRVWAMLDAAEEKALHSTTSDNKKQDVIAAVYEAALTIDDVDKDSFSDFTEDGFFFTVDGMYNAYDYRIKNEINRIENPAPQPKGIIVEDYSNGKAEGTRDPSSNNVLLVGPYYGLDASFTNQYKNEAQSIAATIGGTYTLIQASNATGPAIAKNMTQKGVVIWDSHGKQSGKSSYLCLTTKNGITTADYDKGWAVRIGDTGAGIDGRYIKNYISGRLSNCFVWMAMCEGMKKEGQGTTGSALLQAGAGGVYGYSQKVTFSGDYRYEAAFWSEMKKGKTVAQAIKIMKDNVGLFDPSYSCRFRVTATDGVNIRSGAGTSYSIIGAIPHGTTVSVTKTSYNWGKTTYNGKTGWICLDYCAVASIGPAWPIVMSATDSFPSNPDGPQNVTCNWKLTGGGNNPAPTTLTYRVTATDGVNMRSGAGTNYSIVGAIPYGTTITVTQVNGNWGKTTYNGKTGWVCLDYCALITSPTSWTYRVSASDGVNMRSGAGTSYSIVGAIPYGTVITVTQKNGNWGKTTYNGKTGWVCLDYCTALN